MKTTEEWDEEFQRRDQRLIEQLIADIQRDTVEACARVADKHAQRVRDQGVRHQPLCFDAAWDSNEIAAAIRALARPPAKGGGE